MEEIIKELHKLYAQYKVPHYLDMAASIGSLKPDNFAEIWEKRVNEGCDREGIPHIY